MAQEVPGALWVSHECIAKLAGYAALECYGVVGMAATDAQNGVLHLLPAHRLERGIEVSYDADAVVIDLHVVLENGVNITSVSKNLVDAVKFMLKRIAEFDDVEVNVYVEAFKS